MKSKDGLSNLHHWRELWACSAYEGNAFRQKQEEEGMFREVVEDMGDFANDKQSQESGRQLLKGRIQSCLETRECAK